MSLDGGRALFYVTLGAFWFAPVRRGATKA